MDLSIIVPVYNEEKNLHLLHKRMCSVVEQLKSELQLERFDYEFVLVNDGSRDQSLEVIKSLAKEDPHIVYINFSRNFGHQIAVSAGLDACIGDAVAIIDADLQDPPELIIDMYKKIQNGYQVAYAQREKREGEGFFKLITAKVFYKILKKITSIDIPLDTGDFRVIDRKVVDVLKEMPEQNKFLRGQIAWAGFNQIAIKYKRDPRHEGETGYTVKKMFNFAMDGITAFSNWPLKVATMAGFLASFLSIALIGYAIISRFILKQFVEGWTSIIICVLFIGGVQLLCLGVMGEYFVRLINNTRNRPLYIIESTNLGGKRAVRAEEKK